MKMQFGKYRGKELTWIFENDKDYAEWVYKHSNSKTLSKRVMQSLFDKERISKCKSGEK